MATLPALLENGDHASRPAANVGWGALYSCTTHGLVYQSDGTTWTTWATLGGAGASELDDLADVNASAPTDGQVLTWDSTPGEWVAAAGGGGVPVNTVTAEATGDVTLVNGGASWVDVLSLVLPAGSNWNVRGYAHFNLATSAGWCKLRILDGGSVSLAVASVYLNNAATDDNLTCEDANVPGGQTVKLQGWTDASSGTSKVTKYDDFGSTNETHTRIIAAPASSGGGGATAVLDGLPLRDSSAENDEFEGTLSAWTTSGSATVREVRSGFAVLSWTGIADATLGMYKALTLDKQYTIKVRSAFMQAGNAHFGLRIGGYTAGLAGIDWWNWGSDLRLKAFRAGEATEITTGPIVSSSNFYFKDQYLRVRANTGGTWDAWYSSDGVFWYTLISGQAESGTASAIWIYCRTGTTGTGHVTLDWFRRET